MGQNENAEAGWQRPFFTIWIGQTISLLGSQLVQFALVWWLTEQTGSATVLAFATMMALLPQVILSPLAGALVDRWTRRVVMIVADGVIALTTVALAVLFALGVVQVWHIYLLMLLRSAGGAFHWPAMQASTTLMVPQAHFSRIAGLNQALSGVANIVSPPLGALLLEVLPMQGILSIDVGTAALAIAPLFFVHIPQPRRKELLDAAKPSVLADFREGLRFVWGWPGVLMILVIATLINMLVTPAFSLLPILITEHFEGGAPELAALQSAFGISIVIGGITLGVWGGFKRRMVTSLLAVAFMGLGTLLLGLTPADAFPLAIVAFFGVGFMNPIANGSLMAVMQAAVPPEMQGRVFTLMGSLAAAMSPIGLAIAGPVADLVGVQIWFLIGGTVMLVLGLAALAVPAIVRLEERTVAVAESEAALDVKVEPVP